MATHARKTPADPNLALRIEVAMLRRHLTVTTLATAVGRTKGAVSHWVNGRYEPPRAMIPTLAAALGVEVEWLMGTNLTEAERAFERVWLEAIKTAGPELAELLTQLGPTQALEALRERAARRAARPSQKK